MNLEAFAKLFETPQTEGHNYASARSRAFRVSERERVESCQIQYMLKIPDERGDHAWLLQPQELAYVTACAKAAYF